ncbi:MAG: hypothetical protein QM817_14450 [Archangium sp.]
MARALGLAIAFALVPTITFFRQQGPTTFEAHRATAEDPFEVSLTLRQGPFSSVDQFTAGEPRVLVMPKNSASLELLPADGGTWGHPIFSMEIGEPTEDELGPIVAGGAAYRDALTNRDLDFTWTFPGSPLFWGSAVVSVLAAIGGLALGFLSGRRGT